MTERNTSLRARSGSVTAINSSRKWHALPESMKFSTLRLILLLGILFIPALCANAETWEPITCINVNQDLRQSQTSDGNGLATITMQNGAWFYWEQKKNDPWAGLMHFTPSQDKDGKGYGVRFTIKAKDGYRITKVIFRDTEGEGTYRNDEGILRLSVENNNYSKRWDKYSLGNYVDPSKKGKYQDNNNMVFENTDDNPVQSLTFKCHNYWWSDQFKCRMIMVICKKVPDYKFSQNTYNLKVGEMASMIFKSPTKGVPMSEDIFTYNPNGVVHITLYMNHGLVAIADKPGTTTVTANLPSDNDYVKYSISAKFNVSLYDQPATLSSTSAITMNAWDKPDAPTVKGLPADYNGSVTWKSSDESVAKVQNGKIVFGGTGYGKTATITVTLPQTNKYNAKQFSFTVTVNNAMRIASKADWETFCSQVRSGNSGINATLTQDITDPVTTSTCPEEAFSSGTPESLAKVSYSGTFEGGNHSIALNLSGGLCTAPFSAVSGATIRNLTVTGKIAASDMFAASLVGFVINNAVTIEHCQSSVAITSTVDGAGDHGGLVGDATAPVKINNCIFSGSITGAKTIECGGLVGWTGKSGSSITNCLITATYSIDASRSNSVAGNAQNATINNVYFLNALGDHPAGAEQVSDAQLKSGYVAHQLQNGQNPQVWGQKINSGDAGDKLPVFSTDSNKRVYTSTFRASNDNNKVLAIRYCNQGQTPAELTQDEFATYVKTKDHTHYITYQRPALTPQGTADRNIDVKVTDQAYLPIHNATDWNSFCDYVNHYSNQVSAKMTSDVTLDASSPMAGTKQVFAGRFDGDGHTLTVNYMGTAQATAPFAQAGGAVIENLKTAGTVEQKGTGITERHASGLVGSAFDVTFNNCEVAVELIFNVADQIYSGGFVGHGHATAVTMNNCKFSGKFTGKAGNIVGVAGFVGWSAKTVNISNSYVGGTYTNVTKVHPLVYSTDNPTVTGGNNYYCFAPPVDNYRSFGNATQVTADVAKSGSVTYALQHGTDAKGWSQSLPGDNEPMLVFSGAKTVNKVEFVYNNSVKATRYANTGSTLLGGVPTLKDILGGDYNDSYYYEDFTFNPAFNDESVVSKDTQVKVSLKASEYFTINNRVAWEKFCALVNGGNTKLAAKMTADVIDAVNTMAGTSARPYQGTFDGQGHSLSLGLFQKTEGAAPFAYVDGATIKGLQTGGLISTSAKYAGGIVGVVKNSRSTVSDCQSDVLIESSVDGDATHGGIVGLAIKPVDIENCAFTGVIHSTTSYNCGGILGWASSGGNTIKNCLVTGILDVNLSVSYENSEIITRNGSKVEVSNTYYLRTPHAASKGVQVTDEQLKNGYVASLLQEGQQQSVWAFSLGGGTILHAFSHPEESEENPNYVYYDSDAEKWRCKNYRITDGAAYQDSYVDFTTDRISYLRSLSADRRYTWCQPYTLTYSEDMPFKAYQLMGSSNGNAVFTQLANGESLEAFKPYLIVMKESKQSLDYDKEITVKHYDGNAQFVQQGNIKMTGTVKTISNSEASELGAYIMQNDNSWRKVMADQDATAYIPPFRAYLTVDGGAAGAKIGSVLSDGTTTGVENIILKDNDGTTHIYDLRGMDRGTDFDSLPTGVYIRGGKKVVKK